MVNLGAQVLVPELVDQGEGREGRRDPGLPGRHAEGRAPAQHPRAGRGDPGGAWPKPGRPLLVVGGPRFDVGPRPRARRGPDLRQGHDARRGRLVPGALAAVRVGPVTRPEVGGVASPTAGTCPTATRTTAAALVDGAYVLGMFGDVATELCIRTDGDEGLFAGVLQVSSGPRCGPATCWRRRPRWSGSGTRSREVAFVARVCCRAAPERGPSAAEVLAEPVVVVRAGHGRRPLTG